jgi:superfamily I DNA and/or RNA helicase
LGIPELSDISIDTVERYQGSQRDVIIYDFAVSDDSQLEFLTATCFEDNGHVIDRKLNVAMTRARKQLLMTGKTAILQRNAIFAALMERYTKNYL